MKIVAVAALWVLSTYAGVVSAKTYDSVPIPQGRNLRVVLNPLLPDRKVLPRQSAPIPGSNYVVIQARGGSVLLGPLMGSVNIKAKTEALANQSKASGYVGTDIAAIAAQSLARIGVGPGPEEGGALKRSRGAGAIAIICRRPFPRIKGNPNATAVFGGLIFGVHRMARDAVHTLTE
jgi:hypothetical protein